MGACARADRQAPGRSPGSDSGVDTLGPLGADLDRRAMAALSAGHFATDFANGALPALLPFFVDRFSLSYTLAAALMLASAASSSLIQPLFGAWSDRRGALWLLPTGVAVAGIGIAVAAASPSYWLVVLLVVVSGFGVAAYHPEGSKFAAYASGSRRASGMRLFPIGGADRRPPGSQARAGREHALRRAFDTRVRAGRRRARGGCARARRRLRDQHLRRDDGDEPGVPAAPDRNGLGPLDRALDRPRRDRCDRARGARRLGRPAHGDVRRRRC